MSLLEYAQQIRIEELDLADSQSVNCYAGELRLVGLLAGQCLLELGGHNLTLEPGEIALIPKLEFYRITAATETVSGLSIELPSQLGELFELRSLSLGVKLLRRTGELVSLRITGERQTWLRQLLAMLTHQREHDSYSVYERLNVVELVLIEVKRMMGEQRELREESGFGEAQKSQLIKGVISHINERYAEDIHLDSIAKKFWVSPSYLSRQFKDKLGLNITRFIMERRVYAAQNLLLTTDFRISEIALQTGFRGATYFNTVFKRITGVSPSEYRSQKRLHSSLALREDSGMPRAENSIQGRADYGKV